MLHLSRKLKYYVASWFRGRSRNVRILTTVLVMVSLLYVFGKSSNINPRIKRLTSNHQIELEAKLHIGSGKYMEDARCLNGEKRNFVYIKMFKCASSTLADIFRRFGYVRNLSFVLPPEKRIYIGWPYKIDRTLYRPSISGDYNILCEHAVYDKKVIKEMMPGDTVYITSLREPFSQFKSMLNYYNVGNITSMNLTGGASVLSLFLSDINKYETIYKSPEASRLRYCVPNGFSMSKNLLSFNLGFSTGFHPETRDMSEDSDYINNWLKDVATQFTDVILTERFYETMILLRQKMCWSVEDILFRTSNSLSYGYKKQRDESLVERYRTWSKVDFRLYELYNSSISRLLLQQDDGFWKEVSNYKAINQVVNNICSDAIKANISTQTKSPNDSNFEKTILTISETEWNRKFSITVEFCKLLLGDDLLGKLKERYDKKVSKDGPVVKPSENTC